MDEKASENVVSTSPDQLEGQEEEEKSRGEDKGKEKVQTGEEENVEEFLALKPDQVKNNKEERPASKNKPGRVHSVFSLVRNQIRGQPCNEVSRMGMMQVTRQLDRSNDEQEVFEDTPKKEVQESLEVQEETTVNLENQTKEESKKDECLDLLWQLLKSIEGLRKELAEELNLLRQESRSNTDKLLQELVNANTNTSVSVPPLPGAPKRRLLRRTLTSMAPNKSTAQAFRPRCMSEPVGSQKAEIASTGKGTLPVSSVLPSLVVTQHAKKPVHKPRVNNPQS